MQMLITLIDLQSMCNRSILRFVSNSDIYATISLNNAFDFKNVQYGNFLLTYWFREFDDECEIPKLGRL